MELNDIIRDQLGIIFGKASVTKFSIRVDPDKEIQKGQFILAIGDNRIILARIVDIETQTGGTIGHCEVLGEIEKGSLYPANQPPRPGDYVYNPKGEFLSKIITRTDPDTGLYIGRILTHPDFVPVYYNMKDLRVHVFVSATTGGGKSYTMSVFIEELIKKARKNKDLSIVIFDIHDEYSGLIAENKNPKQVEMLKEYGLEPEGFRDDVLIFDWENNPPYLSPIFTPDRLLFLFSMKETRLALQLKQLMNNREAAHINELIRAIESGNLHGSTRQALLSRVAPLKDSGFLSDDFITPSEFSVPGKVTIFRLIGTPLGDIGIRFFVADIARQLFEAKKTGKIKHNILIIVDEAHLFAPAKGKDDPVKEVLIRIAREGRKMGVWLILATQTPRDLSNEIIMNCSTIIALKMQRSDINRLMKIFGVSKSLAETLTRVRPGECLIKAPSFMIPLLVKIRPRQSSELKGEGVDVQKLMQEIKEVALKTREFVKSLRRKHVKVREPPQRKLESQKTTKKASTETSQQVPSSPKSVEIIDLKPTPPSTGTSKPVVSSISELPSKTSPQERETSKRIESEEAIENKIRYVASILADQIKTYDESVLDLVYTLLAYDALPIEEVLQLIPEDLLDELIMDGIIRIENEYVKLNLDRKLELYLRRRDESYLLRAKQMLKKLLEAS